ncbi:mRNA-degrading endonuclease YafQ of YafQ-DinJ toxin-antitoxin module [Pedobacter sp. W3I1]|uniref:hypothetical protein n=1 Tax=Pedobacter sp. W3I1 TaxID=3042291 RepID=UPI002781754B|nr:hypothetical protein [Pedobacter sp. W3I1]MDQ0640205.1 mRNA-degrading endonuclease YafQ of YafQ-DinJ toxin-antitoxin module [Pedobacter sp. W3I1]
MERTTAMNPATFQSLKSAFTTKNTEFEKFERDHKAKLPKKRSEYEEVLKELTEILSQFAHLQYDFVQLEVEEKYKEFKAQHIDAINIVINRIQYVYIMPLSLALGRNYNKFNFRVAVASILIGAAIPYIISGICQWVNPSAEISTKLKSKQDVIEKKKISPVVKKAVQNQKIRTEIKKK